MIFCLFLAVHLPKTD